VSSGKEKNISDGLLQQIQDRIQKIRITYYFFKRKSGGRINRFIFSLLIVNMLYVIKYKIKLKLHVFKKVAKGLLIGARTEIAKHSALSYMQISEFCPQISCNIIQSSRQGPAHV
jgi:hypothetical protein